MNRWDCDKHGCNSTAVGSGGAVGLRAIGWYFVRGKSSELFPGAYTLPRILCPFHRPDGIPCRENPESPLDRTYQGQNCGLCIAEDEAKVFQAILEPALPGVSSTIPFHVWKMAITATSHLPGANCASFPSEGGGCPFCAARRALERLIEYCRLFGGKENGR